MSVSVRDRLSLCLMLLCNYYYCTNIMCLDLTFVICHCVFANVQLDVKYFISRETRIR